MQVEYIIFIKLIIHELKIRLQHPENIRIYNFREFLFSNDRQKYKNLTSFLKNSCFIKDIKVLIH